MSNQSQLGVQALSNEARQSNSGERERPSWATTCQPQPKSSTSKHHKSTAERARQQRRPRHRAEEKSRPRVQRKSGDHLSATTKHKKASNDAGPPNDKVTTRSTSARVQLRQGPKPRRAGNREARKRSIGKRVQRKTGDHLPATSEHKRPRVKHRQQRAKAYEALELLH